MKWLKDQTWQILVARWLGLKDMGAIPGGVTYYIVACILGGVVFRPKNAVLYLCTI